MNKNLINAGTLESGATDLPVTNAARTLGRLGGQSTSNAKRQAARINGCKGGRPRRKLYQIWAGEGDILQYVTDTDNIVTARRLLTRESCNGARNVMLKMRQQNGEYATITNPYDPDLP